MMVSFVSYTPSYRSILQKEASRSFVRSRAAGVRSENNERLVLRGECTERIEKNLIYQTCEKRMRVLLCLKPRTVRDEDPFDDRRRRRQLIYLLGFFGNLPLNTFIGSILFLAPLSNPQSIVTFSNVADERR